MTSVDLEWPWMTHWTSKDRWSSIRTWNLHDKSPYRIRTGQIPRRCWFRRYKIRKCNRPLEKVCQWTFRSMAETGNEKANHRSSGAGILWCSIYFLSIGHKVSQMFAVHWQINVGDNLEILVANFSSYKFLDILIFPNLSPRFFVSNFCHQHQPSITGGTQL